MERERAASLSSSKKLLISFFDHFVNFDYSWDQALEGHFCQFQGTTAFGRCSVPGISGHGRCRFRCDMHAIFNALEII